MKKHESTGNQPARQCLPLHGAFGIMGLFVVASIAYSTYVIIAGTDGYVPIAMVAPQATFAAWLAVYKFGKG